MSDEYAHLTTAYMAGFHSRNDEIRSLQSEITLLKQKLESAEKFIRKQYEHCYKHGGGDECCNCDEIKEALDQLK